MRINGHWEQDEDGLRRPVVVGQVRTDSGEWIDCPFLIDTGAHRTVFSADILAQLGRTSNLAVRQLGGAVETREVWTEIKLTRSDGGTAVIGGMFAAFADPAALEESVLGRDLLDVFALIVDKAGDTVCLVRDRHRYVIQEC